MKYQEYIPKNNWLSLSSKSTYDKVQLNRDEKFQHPGTLLFIKESLPIKIINGINGKNKKEVYNALGRYSFSREISKDEFEKNRFLAGKISSLGVEAIYEREFIKQIPIPYEIEEKNKKLIDEKRINSQTALKSLVQNSDFVTIENNEQFDKLLYEEKAVVYIQIDWSGVERIGRVKIIDALMRKDFRDLPKYLINHSNQEHQFFNQYIQQYNKGIGRLASYGSGEILLLKKGKIIDYIERGFLINQISLVEIFKQWMN